MEENTTDKTKINRNEIMLIIDLGNITSIDLSCNGNLSVNWTCEDVRQIALIKTNEIQHNNYMNRTNEDANHLEFICPQNSDGNKKWEEIIYINHI